MSPSRRCLLPDIKTRSSRRASHSFQFQLDLSLTTVLSAKPQDIGSTGGKAKARCLLIHADRVPLQASHWKLEVILRRCLG